MSFFLLALLPYGMATTTLLECKLSVKHQIGQEMIGSLSRRPLGGVDFVLG